MSTIAIRKKVSFAAVPDIIFSLNMKPASILVLAWALGRHDGWTFHICHMLKVLNFSENQWKTAKNELIANGFFNQKKYRDDQGKIHWVNEFCDDPLWKFDATTPPPIPKKTIPEKPRDGEPIHGKGGGIAEDVDSRVLLEAAEAECAQDSESVGAAASLNPNLKSKNAGNNVNPDDVMRPLLKNALDFERWDSLKADFGDEELRAAIKKVIATGKKPFCSAITKLLRPPKTLGGASLSNISVPPKPPGKLEQKVLAEMKAKIRTKGSPLPSSPTHL